MKSEEEDAVEESESDATAATGEDVQEPGAVEAGEMVADGVEEEEGPGEVEAGGMVVDGVEEVEEPGEVEAGEWSLVVWRRWRGPLGF